MFPQQRQDLEVAVKVLSGGVGITPERRLDRARAAEAAQLLKGLPLFLLRFGGQLPPGREVELYAVIFHLGQGRRAVEFYLRNPHQPLFLELPDHRPAQPQQNISLRGGLFLQPAPRDLLKPGARILIL